MRKRIGIVGAGVGGLHLGLHLRQHDIDVTIISDRTADQLANARLPNTAAHFAATLELERFLGLDYWRDIQFQYTCHNHSFDGPARLEFRGDFLRPARAVDHRIYVPKLMETFEGRGGKIEISTVTARDLVRVAQRHDLLIVAAGRGSLADAFESLQAWSPNKGPQWQLLGGLFSGIKGTDPVGATLSVSPSHGELIDIPLLTFGGLASALLFENIPGGDLEALVHLRCNEDRRHFIAAVLEKIERHHPHIYNRIDVATFDLCAPNDLIQGAVTPVVRRATLNLGDGKFALAMGDAHCTVDPLLAQGANNAAHAAAVLANEIAKDSALDAQFCEQAERHLQQRALASSQWTNLMLQPPSSDLMELVVEMSMNKALCDEFTNNFDDPERQWNLLASPERIRAWIDGSRRGPQIAAMA